MIMREITAEQLELDSNDPMRVIAQTKVGINAKFMVSTVRTPLSDLYETCIFNDLTRQSSLVAYGIAGRQAAFESHTYWLKEVFTLGYIFDKEEGE
jgi:hypothetical protein